MIDAPYLSQRGRYPTGCEAVSAVMALQYAGLAVGVAEFIDLHLPRGQAPRPDGAGGLVGCDPSLAFPGDPRSDTGWGCFAPVIAAAINSALSATLSGLPSAPRPALVDLTGKPLVTIVGDYLDRGVPVMVWATIGMAQPPLAIEAVWRTPEGRVIEWRTPEHCLLLVGVDEEFYYFHDPLVGAQTPYAKAATEAAHEALGRQALALVGPGGPPLSRAARVDDSGRIDEYCASE